MPEKDNMPIYHIKSEQLKEPKSYRADDLNDMRLTLIALFEENPSLKYVNVYEGAYDQKIKKSPIGKMERDFLTMFGAPRMAYTWTSMNKLYAISPASGDIMFLRRSF